MIKLVPDLGAPALVFAADWATSAYDEKTAGFKLNRPIGIVLTIAGYACAMFGWGGDFVKNIGIASFPWGANSIVGFIKERAVKERAGASARIPVSTRQIGRYPAPAYQKEFESVRLVG